MAQRLARLTVGIPAPVAATATNLAGWHDTNLTALGYDTEYADGLWLTRDCVPGIFLSAIAVRPGASAEAAASRTTADVMVSASDPWMDLDLGRFGFRWESDSPWMLRAAGSKGESVEPHATGPTELRIERVCDGESLREFELLSAAGFGSPVPPPFTWHGPPVLRDGRLAFWIGRVDGRPVAGSISFVCGGVVGIYGVSTVPDARRHGYATALTRAALRANSSLPAVLQPSPMAEPLYRRLGFERFTMFRTWAREARYSTPRSNP